MAFTDAFNEPIDEKRKVVALERIADNLEQQNKLIENLMDICKRVLATQILNSKINARIAVTINALDVLAHKEFLDIVNQI